MHACMQTYKHACIYALKTNLDSKSRLGNIGAFGTGFIERISRCSRISPHPKNIRRIQSEKSMQI